PAPRAGHPARGGEPRAARARRQHRHLGRRRARRPHPLGGAARPGARARRRDRLAGRAHVLHALRRRLRVGVRTGHGGRARGRRHASRGRRRGVGVVRCTLLAILGLAAAQLFAGAVPAIAALGAALYGPFLLHEPLLVRDSLGVTTSLLLLWWLARCDAGVRRWLVAGALFALALLARESTLLFGPLIGLWIVQRFRAEPRILRRAALALVAGAALGFAPLVARNLAVGAPPLSFSTRALDTFVYGNAADSSLVSTR